MKFLKKASLAAAIAAASISAQAEMVALDDATMSATTGQSGVTVEITIGGSGITVGEIEYTDTGSGATGGGSVLLQNLNVNNINGLTQEIDINEEGDLLITQTGATGVTVSLGDVAGAADNAFSAVALKGTNGTAELVDSLSMNLDLGASTITIHNMADGSTVGSAAGVTGSFASMTSSVAIQMSSSIKINDLDAQIFGYTQAQATTKANNTVVADLDGNGTADEAADKAMYAAALADGGAVTISNLTFDNNGAAATMNQTIWADTSGVYIQMGAIQGDLVIGDIAVGSVGGAPASIGSLAVRDIDLAGLTQRISGH